MTLVIDLAFRRTFAHAFADTTRRHNRSGNYIRKSLLVGYIRRQVHSFVYRIHLLQAVRIDFNHARAARNIRFLFFRIIECRLWTFQFIKTSHNH